MLIVWLPTPRAVVLNVACPPATATPDARVVLPSRNATVPVGVPELLVATVAVRVRACPNRELPAEALTVVVVLACVITWGAAESSPVTAKKSRSPAYTALMTWLPRPRADVLKVARPELSRVTLDAKVVVPSTKFTAPVGERSVGSSDVIAAVNVTGWP